MNTISTNELKTRDILSYFREMELKAALLESRQDLAQGKVIKESAKAHVQRMFD